jgi:HD-GYP domain-containing protein (c-di-GMP phosphodiesterase class II)
MCAIAEAFDAMVSGLCGGARRTIPVALERLREEAGGQFDPDLVEHFGTAIRVHAQEYGIGVSAHAGTATLRDLLASLETDRGFA